VVAALLADDAELPRADAVALIVAEGLRKRSTSTRVRALIASDSATAERLRAALGDAALGELRRPIETLLDGMLPLRPQPTAEPERKNDRPKPTSTPKADERRRILPNLGITATPTATPTVGGNERDDKKRDQDSGDRDRNNEDSGERDDRRSSSSVSPAAPALAITDRIGDAIAVTTTRERAARASAADKAAEKAADRAAEKATDKATEKAAARAAEKAAARATNKAGDAAASSGLTDGEMRASGRAASEAGPVDRERDCRAISDAILDQSIGGRGKAHRMRTSDAALRNVLVCAFRDSERLLDRRPPSSAE
ncbi:MAG: hypothetical protein O3B31_04875, partial [Chloroflexi bacterium]|nr:hypothetical protein [Chloroflexota bacterium]